MNAKSKPSGKLLFALETIVSLEEKLRISESMHVDNVRHVWESRNCGSCTELAEKHDALAEEIEALKDWRLLALKFDGHRMQAMPMLKMIAAGNFDIEEVRQFIAAAPVSGDEHLRQVRADAVTGAINWLAENYPQLANPSCGLLTHYASILAGKEGL